MSTGAGETVFGAARSQAPHSPLALADLQPCLAPNPLHSLRIYPPAFTSQQHRDPTLTITRILLAQLDDLALQLLTTGPLSRSQVVARTRQSKSPTSLGRVAQSFFHHTLRRPSSPRRTYHFLEFTSLSVWICTAWSATTRLSRAFSSSNTAVFAPPLPPSHRTCSSSDNRSLR